MTIKRLRFWMEDTPNRVFKVLESSSTSYFAVTHLANSNFVRSFVLHGSILFPHGLRLDGKWECDGIHQVQPRRKPFAAGEPTRYFPDPVLNVPQLSGVMSGVSYLHDLGVVHGDLKGYA